MTNNIAEEVWLTEHATCSIHTIIEVSGLSEHEIHDLIANNVLIPVDAKADPLFFSLRYMVTANKARRLRDDFELDCNGMTLALTLMARIDQLQRELHTVKAQLNQ